MAGPTAGLAAGQLTEHTLIAAALGPWRRAMTFHASRRIEQRRWRAVVTSLAVTQDCHQGASAGNRSSALIRPSYSHERLCDAHDAPALDQRLVPLALFA
jgi:hypothetical protein